MSALASAVLGGGTTITINFDGGNCLQQSTCCSKNVQGQFDNRKVVLKDSSDKESTSCLDSIKKFFSCCCSTAEEDKTLPLFERYLAERYGPMTARMAPPLAGVNLALMKEKKERLLAGHVFKIEAAAEELKQIVPQLRRLHSHLRFYDIYQKATTRDSPILASASKQPCLIADQKGQATYLDRKKIEDELRQLPNYHLFKKDAESIIDGVVDFVAKNKQHVFSEEDIRKLIAKQLKIHEIVLPKPKISEHQTRKDLVDTLLRSTSLENLSEAEFCDFYAFLKETSHKSNFSSPSEVKRRFTDEKHPAL